MAMLSKFNRYFAKHGRVTFIAILLIIIGPFVFFFGPQTNVWQWSGFMGEGYGRLCGDDVSELDFERHLYGYVIQARGDLPQNLQRERGRYLQNMHPAVFARIRLLHEAKLQGCDQVTTAQVADAIRAFGPFQKDGQFSTARYEEFKAVYLPAQGLTMREFERIMRDNLVLARVHARFGDLPVTEAELRAGFLRDKTEPQIMVRRFSYFELPKANVTESEIQACYQNEKGPGGKYYVPAKTGVQVAVFPAAAERPTATVTDAEVEARYQQDFETQYRREQIQASQILFRCEATADAAARQTKREKAQQVLAEATGGADFAKLATTHSEDLGSKSKGGALGWLAKDRLGLAKPNEDAVWALKPGDLSAVLETPAGFVVLKKTGQRDAIPLEEVKDTLRTKLQTQKTTEAETAAAKAHYDAELAADAGRPAAERVYLKKQYHLLSAFVPTAADASDDDRKLNRNKAEELLKEARAKNNFAQLADQHSEGGLGVKGDLGYVEESALPDQPFVKEALKLAKGEISAVIEQPTGYYLMQKADERDAVPFTECQRQIVADLQRKKDEDAKTQARTAAKAFLDAVNAAAKGQELAGIQAQFAAVATQQTIKLVSPPPFAKDDLAIKGLDGDVRALLEAATVLNEAQPLTSVVECARTLYVACFQKLVPGREPPLAEVTAKIRADLERGKRIQAAREKAQQARTALAAELAAGKTIETLQEQAPFQPYRASGRDRTAEAEIATAAQRLPLRELALVNDQDGATLLYVKDRLIPAPEDYAQELPMRKLLHRRMGAAQLYQAYEEELAKRYPFDVNPQWESYFQPPKTDRVSGRTN